MNFEETPKVYTLDDTGNVERFVDEFEGELMFVSQHKKWFYWTGATWTESIGQHAEAAVKLMDSMHIEAAQCLARADMEGYKRLTIHITKSAGKIPYLLGLAAQHPRLRSDVAWLDCQPTWLNCGNYVINVQNGLDMAPDPLDRLTKRTRALYVPGATCPKWDQFLLDVLPDPQIREYVHRLVGYSLLGNVQERLIVFLHGVGRNGKSVFVETIREVLGDYAVGTPIQTFLKKPNASGPSNDLARLRGARLVAASEFEEGAKINTTLLKQVTGDEKITARPMYGEYFDFAFEGTIWVSTNHIPFVGAQQAVWDRIKPIPFVTRISDDKVDVRIKSKLIEEAPGILQWMLAGAKAYLANGLDTPTSVMGGIMEMRHDQDLIAPFVDEACEVDAMAVATVGELYRAYTWWAMQSGEKPVTKLTFVRRLGEGGYAPCKMTGGVRGYRGLRIKTGVLT